MSGWDAYVKKLYGMRAQEMLDIYAAADKRFKS